jgi:hypothetical protein
VQWDFSTIGMYAWIIDDESIIGISVDEILFDASEVFIPASNGGNHNVASGDFAAVLRFLFVSTICNIEDRYHIVPLHFQPLRLVTEDKLWRMFMVVRNSSRMTNFPHGNTED